MSPVSIKFTQEQARILAGVSPGDMRHWRKVVPYLAQRSGKATRFSFSDLIALAAVAELSKVYGIQVRLLSASIDALFKKLADVRPVNLSQVIASLTSDEAMLLQSDEVNVSGFPKSSVIVLLGPLVERVRTQMLPFGSAPDQVALPFPPQAVKAST